MNLSLKHYLMILAALVTAWMHISLYPDIMFTLNGLGYLGLIGAYFLPIAFFQQNHKLVWWALFGYTALTILLWVVMGDKTFVAGTDSAIGYYAKAAEVVLMIAMWGDKKS
jgi:hypothetical protein